MNALNSLLATGAVVAAGFLLSPAQPASAATRTDSTDDAYVVAVLPFASSGKDLEDIGAEIPAILAADLTSDPALLVVERGDVEDALSEMELSLSGVIDPSSTVKLGHLTGAQVLVTGRVFPARKELVLVAKIIGVETGRVYGRTTTLPFSGSLVAAVQALGESIRDDIVAKGDTLIARVEPEEDLVTKLKREVGEATLPSVTVAVSERSLQRRIVDPAAETEIAFLLSRIGFTVMDPATTTRSPDIEITGEAFSEFGLRKGNLVSSKGRLELKAVDRETGRVVFVDRAVTVAVDLSPEIAGKTALARGAAQLTERLVPALMAR